MFFVLRRHRRASRQHEGLLMDILEYRTTTLSQGELALADAVHADLARAVQELADAQLRTELPLDQLTEIADRVRDLASALTARARTGSFGIELDQSGGAREHGNAVLGLRNPFASAVGEHAMFWDEHGASAALELGPLYEGPPGCVHGGVIALVLDQLFTEAAASVGHIGMTAQLSVSYRRPTPLGRITVVARLESLEGVKRTMKATCTDANGNLTAEAEALLIMPRWVSEDTVWPKRAPRRTSEGDGA